MYANAILLQSIYNKSYKIFEVHLTHVNLGIGATTMGRQRNPNNGLICGLRNCYTIYMTLRMQYNKFGHYIKKKISYRYWTRGILLVIIFYKFFDRIFYLICWDLEAKKLNLSRYNVKVLLYRKLKSIY